MLERGRCGGIMTMEELLAHVKGSSTDLTRIIEAAGREDWPCVVVTSRAVAAWERRAPGRQCAPGSLRKASRCSSSDAISRRAAYVTRRCWFFAERSAAHDRELRRRSAGVPGSPRPESLRLGERGDAVPGAAPRAGPASAGGKGSRDRPRAINRWNEILREIGKLAKQL